MRSARRRVAFHADRARRVEGDPEGRFAAARAQLMAAVANAKPRAGNKTAREISGQILDHARQLAGYVELGRASVDMHEGRIASAGTDRAKLGYALLFLAAGIDEAPERDSYFARYADVLARRAGELDARNLPR